MNFCRELGKIKMMNFRNHNDDTSTPEAINLHRMEPGGFASAATAANSGDYTAQPQTSLLWINGQRRARLKRLRRSR